MEKLCCCVYLGLARSEYDTTKVRVYEGRVKIQNFRNFGADFLVSGQSARDGQAGHAQTRETSTRRWVAVGCSVSLSPPLSRLVGVAFCRAKWTVNSKTSAGVTVRVRTELILHEYCL